MTNEATAFKVKREPPNEPSESPRHMIEVILEIKKEMNVADLMIRGSSPGPSNSNTSDSNITLWQFLLELLQQDHNGDIIEWTRGAEGEFRLIDAEAVAKKWGQRKAKPHMNYDKLSRALRYYYEKNIIKKVIGKKFVYRFVTDPNAAAEYQHLKMCYVKEEKDLTSHEIPSFLPPVTHQRTDFSVLSLAGTESPTTAHSVSTPSPSDSVCSPSSSNGSSTTAVNNSVSPVHFTSSMVEEPSSHTSRKRSRSPSASVASSTSSTFMPTSSMKSNVKSEMKSEAPPSKRGVKPNPLNLTATSNFVVPPISPLLLLHQNSPLLAPNLTQLYAITLASAGLCGPQMSPLFAAHSPFRSPMTTPKNLGLGTGVPNSEGSSSDSQVFQFPPVSAFQTNPLMNTFPNIISPMAPFMMPSQSSTSFKFPSTTDSLKTPTVPLKLPTL